ncbi:DUF7345 domain-containing protein [Haloferax massiliensis]|uniref:MarR family protein n=1 Tax=Haloferax massiliensis TaxID=1476858 RepID=A0A0D6JMQ6_9EURY|nr:hypothetical protein [Haloferax massiliensis]CQR48863.1 hypothetical protein BN996_00312 [Haloferax massiliensis]
MATRDAVFVLLCAALCVAAVVAPTAAAQEAPASGPGVEPLVQQGVEPDSTRIVVDVSESGDATWEIQYWTRLDDENTTEAFQSLRDDVRANPDDYTSAFAERIASTVGAAENATGREMNATNVSVSAETRSLPDSFGVVSYSFEWSNFAAVDGDRLVVGDAIEGFFLDSSSRLILSWPDDYDATTVEPAGDETREHTVIWRGSQTEFVSGEPSVVLERGAGGPGTSATASDDESDAGGDGGDEPSPPPELLSNEERVLRLIESRGGRIKQQEVAGALDWTDAKTSKVVRGMRDEGTIEGFRLGRENVLRLPEDDEGADADDGDPKGV